MDVFDDHLARRDRTKHFLAHGLLSDLIDEMTGDRERDVRLQQRNANLSHRSAPAKPVKYAAESIAHRVEHSNLLRCVAAYMGRQNAKYAGGRNLVGQRACASA